MCKHASESENFKPTPSVCLYSCDRKFNNEDCEHSLADFAHDPLHDVKPSKTSFAPSKEASEKHKQNQINMHLARVGLIPTTKIN